MKSGRIIQLDGIRFIAVFMIFIAHWGQKELTNPILLEIPFVHGVTLFFVLSGFLITRSLFINGDKGNSILKIIKVFYLRRFLRIFPIYYLLLFILFIINYEMTRELIWWLATYTTNIYQSITNLDIKHLNHLWSLGVEEQFYIFWPFVILLTKPSFRFLIICFTIVFSLIIKAYLFLYVGKWMATAYFTLSCMYALGLGALLSYIILYKKELLDWLSSPKWIYIGLFIYLILILLRINSNFPWFKEIFDEFIFAFISMLIILRASNNNFSFLFKKILENRFVVYLGKISYGLYLYHLLVPSLYSFLALKLNFEIEYKPLLFPIYFIITFMLSHLSWIYIEKPINKLKNKEFLKY